MQKLSEKQQLALDLSRNLAITAGAGSGKTAVLVSRYLHILIHFNFLSVKDVLAITFTEKATAEMKDRIFNMIRQQFTESRSQQGRLFEILNELQDAQIFTIHAFCGHILRQYPLESGVSADFSILSDVETAELLHRIFREFLSTFKVESHPEGNIMLRAFREFSAHRLLEMLRFFYQKRTQLFPFLEASSQKSPQEIQNDWEQIFLEYHLTCLHSLLNNPPFWNDLKVLCEWQTVPDTTGSKIQHRLKAQLADQKNNSANNMSRLVTLIQIITLLTKSDGNAYSSVPGGKKSWGEDGANLFKKLSVQAATVAPLILPYEPETEETTSLIQKGLALIVLEFFRIVEKEKTRVNVLDFDDLLIYTLKLIHSAPDIHTQLRKQYKFILVDEYQDTDLLQDNLIHLLCHDHLGNMDQNKLFIVGDPKQSIFGFRNADVSLFQTFMQEISDRDTAPLLAETNQKKASKTDGIIVFDQNYRSSPQLIHFYNTTFKDVLQKDSEFDVDFQSLESTREEPPLKVPSVHLDLFLSDEEDRGEKVLGQARIISRHIHQIVNNAEYQKFSRSENKPTYEVLGYGDIAVLIRSRTHLNRLEHTFRQNNIPYQTYKGAGFFHRQEVQDIYYFLRSITYPEDDFALVTVLRSDFIGLSDVTLFLLNQVKGNTYWERLNRMHRALQTDDLPSALFETRFAQYLEETDRRIAIPDIEKTIIETTLSLYPGWHHLAINGEYSKLLDDIIEKLHIRILLGAQLDGKQKQANLDKLIHTIFEYEQHSSLYSPDLLNILKKQITGEIQEGEAAILAEEEDKVKIITFHSSKGMEFPVVFLPLLETPFQYNRQLLWDGHYGFSFLLDRTGDASNRKSFAYHFLKLRDRQNIFAEEKRLFYVAATRARDFLFLLGTIDKDGSPAQDSYLNWLFTSHKLHDILLQGSGDETGMSIRIYQGQTTNFSDDLAPRTQQSTADKMIELTDRNIESIFPLRIKPDQPTYSVTQLMIFREDRERYFQHFYLHDGQLKISSLNQDFIDEPGGALWGSLVHKALEYFYLRSPGEDSHKISQLIHLFDFEDPDKKIQQKSTELLNRIRQEKFVQQLKPETTFSEFSVELRLDDFILRGIFDLLFQNPQGIWEIIDYKTNKIKASKTTSLAKKYFFQMKTYALLLASLYPNQQIYPVSLFFTEPMKKEQYIFNTLEIEEVRLETLNLLNQLFKFETSLFHPGLSSLNQKSPEN